MHMHTRDKGFTLIELLIVVAIIGIIAAIAIPNLLNAIHRGKQKRSQADIRSIGTAVESYQVDNGVPPNSPTAPDVRAALSGQLSPTFIKIIPAADGWGGAFDWAKGADEYTISSLGKDRAKEASPPLDRTTSFARDIIYSNGVFTQWPDGTQGN